MYTYLFMIKTCTVCKLKLSNMLSIPILFNSSIPQTDKEWMRQSDWQAGKCALWTFFPALGPKTLGLGIGVASRETLQSLLAPPPPRGGCRYRCTYQQPPGGFVGMFSTCVGIPPPTGTSWRKSLSSELSYTKLICFILHQM